MTPASSPSDQPLRAVLIGLGAPGGDWLATLASPEAEAMGVHLVGLGDPDPDRALAMLARVGRALPVAGDIDQALRLAPNIVVDAGGPGTRLAVAQAALRAGAYVICEPPLAPDADTVTALLGSSRRLGHLAVSHRTRHLVGARQMRELVASRDLGRPRMIGAEISGNPLYRNVGELQALLRDAAPHAFDAARMILGSDAVEVRCAATTASDTEAASGDGKAQIMVTMSCGALFTLAVNSYEVRPPVAPFGAWRLILEDGRAEWAGDGPAKAWRAANGLCRPHPLAALSETPAGLLACLAEAVTALRHPNRGPGRGATRDATASLAITLAALRSDRAGGRPEAVRPLDMAVGPASMARWVGLVREAS